MRGVIATGRVDADELVDRARALPRMEGTDLVRAVTCEEAVRLGAARAGDEFVVAPERPRRAAVPRRRLRLRHEVEHPAPVRRARLRRARCIRPRRPADDAAGDRSRRHLPQQRPGRSGGARLRHRQRARAGRERRADVRHLPGAPGARPGDGRAHLQAEVRPPRGEPSGQGSAQSGKVEITSQNHGFAVDPESLPRRRRGDAPEPVRRHGRGAAAHVAAGLLRAVPSRGVARPARRGLSVRPVPGQPMEQARR